MEFSMLFSQLVYRNKKELGHLKDETDLLWPNHSLSSSVA